MQVIFVLKLSAQKFNRELGENVDGIKRQRESVIRFPLHFCQYLKGDAS